MRRKDREESVNFALRIIDQCEYGVAALCTQDGTPYAVPLSLVRIDKKLYFHCALEGQKIDYLRKNPKISISFVGSNQAATDKFTTYYQSATISGTAHDITEENEKIIALRALCEKLTPANMTGNNFERAIAKSLTVTGIWCVEMETITGKAKKRI